jgi:hypothetical protein
VIKGKTACPSVFVTVPRGIRSQPLWNETVPNPRNRDHLFF